ncbi:MAG: HAMP domain-containing histidine kinase [Synechococcales cyanobacterium C42_A2020_086]|jgi:signal transduction histidine kinase|nr:HAMP domain-containing histidine kinase [Synechococcales cyanobacterium C42_A2020_086]
MSDFSRLLQDRSTSITEQWIAAVERDRQIVSTDYLSPLDIRDHIPHVLTALTTVLSRSQENDVETIARASIEHGLQRAVQGFEPTEIAREYQLLRSIIVANLRDGLLQSPPEEILRALSLINTVVDAAIAQCFKSYVSQRLQELERLQNQLSFTNQELNRLLQASQENLSHLAHELKTPLNSIIGYSELFLRQHRRSDVKDSVPNLEHVERVLRNGRQLLRLINDALELSGYELGKIQLQLIETDVRSIIGTVVEMIQPLADERGLRLCLDCDAAPRLVKTDPLRLQQILTNLGSNAIRYTETGTVTIVCRTLSTQQWELSVQDTGIGIAPAAQAQIFDPYFRIAAADQSHLPDSTGLGLAIVSRLVKLLRGEIRLQSKLGVGSTFTVILPLDSQASD